MFIKYRTRQRLANNIYFAIFFFVLLMLLTLNNNPQIADSGVSVFRKQLETPTCYAILTGGARFKYVYFITELLKSQGVDDDSIYIFHDEQSGHVAPEFTSNHHYLSSMGKKNLADLYTQLFAWLFDDEMCEYAVIMEDDIFPGADAVEYFNWGRRLMEVDKTIMSVSGSHDNAEPQFLLNPQVFVKAEQFLGLGWLTSKHFYEHFLSTINSKISTPWDKQLDDKMNRVGLISVFPHLPRTVHLPWVDGRNGHLVALQLSTDRRYEGQYVPIKTFGDYHSSYVDWLKENFNARWMDDAPQEITYKRSHLAKRPFGSFKGLSIYPTKDGPVALMGLLKIIIDYADYALTYFVVLVLLDILYQIASSVVFDVTILERSMLEAVVSFRPNIDKYSNGVMVVRRTLNLLWSRE